MKILRLVTAVSCLAVLAGSCKKEKGNLNPANPEPALQSQEVGQPKEVEQTFYTLKPGDADKIIKSFKAKTNRPTDLSAADSLALDSSIFVIEAALNYDFDFNDGVGYMVEYDDASYSGSFSNEKVRVDDLESIFDTYSSYLNGLISATRKIKAIDVTASITGPGTITYSMKAAISKVGINPTCLLQANYYSMTNTTTWNGGSCLPGGGNGMDGPTALNNALNCAQYVGCPEGSYHAQVQTDVWSGNPWGNSVPNLLSTGFMSNSWFCSGSWNGWPAGIISQADMNACKTQLLTDVVSNMSNLAGGASAWARINTFVWPQRQLHPTNPIVLSSVFWNMSAMYGTKECRVNVN